MKPIRLENVNFYTALRDLVVNIWVVILAAIVGFLGTTDYYKFMYVPSYTSSMTIIVTEGASASTISNTLSEAIKITSVLGSVFQSDLLRAKVSESLGGSAVTGQISTAQIPETNLITISVTDESPMKAYKTLCAFYENYGSAFSNNILQGINIRIFSPATVPAWPSNSSSTGSRAIKAALFLAVACALLIFLMSFLRDTVKQDFDVEEYVDAPLFSTVFHETAGKTLRARRLHPRSKIMLTDPLISYQFTESFNKMVIKLNYLKSTKDMRIVMVSSVDEHEGKTTVSVNLATALSKAGHKVLLVDADLRRPSVQKFFDNDVSDKEEFSQFLKGNAPLENVICHDTLTGVVYVNSRKGCPNTAELISTGSSLEKFLKANRDNFDYIVVDTPPMSMISDTELIADLVDGALIVTGQDRVAVADLNDSIDILSKSRSTLLGVILNDVHTVELFLSQNHINLFSTLLAKTSYGSSYYGNAYYSKK